VFPRFAHIVKSGSGPNGDAAYAIYDAVPVGDEDSGFAEPFSKLSRQEASRWLASEDIPQGYIDSLLQEVDREGHASVPLKRPKLVRAWFDTVINPLIESLETELVLVRKETGLGDSAPQPGTGSARETVSRKYRGREP
jgi:hypothetical protein